MSPEREAMLQRYLDSELIGDELEAFEQQLASDDSLRVDCERMRSIEQELRSLYAFEDRSWSFEQEEPDARESSAEHGAGRRLRFHKRLRLAGAVALVVVMAAFAVYNNLPNSQPQQGLNALAAHRAFVNDPEPDVVCDTPEKFAQYTVDQFDQVVNASFEQGVTLIGWRAARGVYGDPEDEPGDPRFLLAYGPDDEPVVVLFQLKGDPEPSIVQDSDLRLHSKRLGRVTAWEISASEEPLTLGVLSVDR